MLCKVFVDIFFNCFVLPWPKHTPSDPDWEATITPDNSQPSGSPREDATGGCDGRMRGNPRLESQWEKSSMSVLVGGLQGDFYVSIYWEFKKIPSNFHMFTIS